MSEKKLQDLIQRLRDNDPTLTALDLRNVDGSRSYQLESGSDWFGEMIEVLGTNRTVQSVNLILRFLNKLTIEEKMVLFRAIGSLPKLQHLRIGSSGLAGMALKLITETLSSSSCSQGNNRLTSLTLHSIHFKGKVYYQPSSSSPNSANDKEVVDFRRALQNLRNLETFTLVDVEDSFHLNPLVRTLSSIPSLRNLSIRAYAFADGPLLTMDSLSSLFHSKTLRKLALIRLHLAPFLPERLLDLEDNQILETLNLEQNLMGPECGMALAYLLHTNQSLKEVYAGYNMIPDEYGVRIANSISNNKNIRLLDVSANDLGVESCRAFSNLLSGGRAISSSLENLNLAQNYLQDDGCLFLASALTTNTTLKSLTLAETRLKSHAVCAALATALTENATLERLNLPDNRVRDEGCILLAGALRVNTSLKALNLFANHIGDTGAVAMAQALQENSTLEQLNLASNHGMGHPSYKALETMLETNVVLQHLWMPTILPGSTIPMFLRINKLGRKRLLQEMDNAELWCDAIKACADDIHCLYYLVRTNPTVVSWL